MKHSALEWLNGRLTGFDPIWLVVFRHPSEKYESIGMIVPNIWEHAKNGNQTTNQLSSRKTMESGFDVPFNSPESVHLLTHDTPTIAAPFHHQGWKSKKWRITTRRGAVR